MTSSPSLITAMFLIVFSAPVVLSAFPTRTSSDSDCGEAARTCWCQNVFAQCWAPYEESSMDMLRGRIQQLDLVGLSSGDALAYLENLPSLKEIKFQGRNEVECSCKSLKPFLKYSNVTLVNAASLLFTDCRAHGWEEDAMSAKSLCNLCYQRRLSTILVKRSADDETEKVNEWKGDHPIVEIGEKKSSPALFDFFLGQRKRRSVDNEQTDEKGYVRTGRQRRYNRVGNVGMAGAQQVQGGTREAYAPAQSGPSNYYGPRANPWPAYAGREYGAPGAHAQNMDIPSPVSGPANVEAPGPRQGHVPPGPAYGPAYGPAGPVIPPAEGAVVDFDSVSRTLGSDQFSHEYSYSSSSQGDTISAEVLEKIKAVLGATKIDLPVDINDPYDLGLLLRHLRHHSNLLANIGDPDVRGQVLSAMQEDEYEEERDAATGVREELMANISPNVGGAGLVERRHVRADQQYNEQEEESVSNHESQQEPSDYIDYGEGVQAFQYQNNLRGDYDQEGQQVNRFRSPSENVRGPYPDQDYRRRDLDDSVISNGGMDDEYDRPAFVNEFAQDHHNDEIEEESTGNVSEYDYGDEPEYQQEERRYGQRLPYGPVNNGQADDYRRQETRDNAHGQRQPRTYNIRPSQGSSRGGFVQRRGW